MIITDNHMHLYNHLKFEALKHFKRVGGTHVFLVSLTTTCYNIDPVKGEDFIPVFDSHINMVKNANDIVTAYPILGVHPAEITILGDKIGYEAAANIMKDALSIAGRYVEEGEAVAIKNGRPHYTVSPEIWELSNEVLQHAFEVAKDVDCPVQIHTESYSEEGMKEIADIAKKAGLPADRIVKHFSPPAVEELGKIGMFPSVLASGKNLKEAAKQGSRFMAETDYIDDKRRPGSVLGPKTVPKRVKELTEEFGESLVYKICKENPEKVYGIEMEWKWK
ncbi:MAG: TatD family hydrolase [Archaeoglobaceae archaeon]